MDAYGLIAMVPDVIMSIALQLALSQVILLGFLSFSRQRKTYIGKLLFLFAICMSASLLFRSLELPLHTPLSYFLGRISHATTAAIWLLSYAVFFDNRKVPNLVWFLIAAYLTLRIVGATYYYLYPPVETGSLFHAVFYGVPQAIVTGLWLHMIVLTIAEYKHDLVENRRSLRIAIALILSYFGLLMFADSTFPLIWSMLIEERWQNPEFFRDLLSVSYFPSLLALNMLLLKIDTETIRGFSPLIDVVKSRPKKEDELDEKDVALRDRVIVAMELDKLYLRSGLSIGDLASHLKVQEYKLRSTINRHLNFNNFSSFLNHYRIKDAEYRLINTQDPIFNIGLDVGYNSLSSFHKAFKEVHGSTPREFRILNRKNGNNSAA